MKILLQIDIYITLVKGIASECIFVLFTGPNLPMRLREHTMVLLGKGLAIIGGYGDVNAQHAIHLLSCMYRNCSISTLSQELSMPRYWFVAIPIPDTITGCITGGKNI